MQPLGQTGRAGLRGGERGDQRCRLCGLQPGQRQAACAGLTAQALDALCQPLVAVDVFVAVGVDHEHRPLRRAPGKDLQHLRAGVVGPLDVVDHQDQRPATARGFEELVDRARQAGLARFREIVRQRRQPRHAFADLGHQGGEFGQRHRRQRAQRGIRHAVERARDEVDHRLVGRCAFDLVAVRGQRRHALRGGKAHDLVHQPALADPRFAFDQHRVSGAGGEPLDEPDEHGELLASADEGRAVVRGDRRPAERGGAGFRGARAGGARQLVQRQPVGGAHRPRRVEEGAPLVLGNGQRRGQAFGELA